MGSLIRAEMELTNHGLSLIGPGGLTNRLGWMYTIETVDPLKTSWRACKLQMARVVKKAKEMQASHFASYLIAQHGAFIHIVELWSNLDDAAKQRKDLSNI